MMYFIEEPGEVSCREGFKISTVHECTSACRELGKITGLLKNGNACYISGNRKKCRQDGRGSSKTSLVCVRKGNINIWICIRNEICLIHPCLIFDYFLQLLVAVVATKSTVMTTTTKPSTIYILSNSKSYYISTFLIFFE